MDVLPEDQLYTNMKDFTLPIFKMHLDDGKVKRLYETAVQEITEKGVVVKKNGRKRTIECDTVITAFGLKKNDALIAELKEIVPETYVIGDARKVGLVGDATNSAYYACMSIDS